jgi:hypothetical protein
MMATLTKQRPGKIAKVKKITMSDVEQIAKLCAQSRLTEMEACNVLGIDNQVFRTWKWRQKGNKERFEYIITRLRASRIQGCMEGIYQAGIGDAKTRADWRAFDRYLERVDPARFSDRIAQSPESSTDALADSLLAKMLSRAYAPAQVDCPRKELPEVVQEAEIVQPAPCGDGI